MVGLTVPLPGGHAIQTVIKDGVVAWATTKKIINDYQRIRTNSPYSYVLSLENRLWRESFARQLMVIL